MREVSFEHKHEYLGTLEVTAEVTQTHYNGSPEYQVEDIEVFRDGDLLHPHDIPVDFDSDRSLADELETLAVENM